MSDFPWRLVTIDIDGTLTVGHGWSILAREAGRANAYRRESTKIRGHGIDEDAHLRVLFGLATGLTPGRLDAAIRRTPKVHEIAPAVAALKARGAAVSLLTHNPRYVIQWYDREFGFQGGSGGWGSVLRDGRVAPPGRVRADKVRGLRLLERRFGVEPREVVHVGDAWPDARLAPLVGGFVAFNASDRRVPKVADAVLRTRDLRRLLPVLERLAPRRPVNGARPLAEPSNSPPSDGRSVRRGVRRP
jgi:phosphoserine phosphatase